MNTQRILPKLILWIEETNWFSSSGNWAYSNRVWTVQTRTSSTSRRIGRSRTGTSWYSYWKYSKFKSWKGRREIRNFDSRNSREEGRKSFSRCRICTQWTIISRSKPNSVISSSSWTRRIAEPRPNFAAKYVGYAWYIRKRFWTVYMRVLRQLIQECSI